MHINLSGHHLDITDAIRNHVHDKFARLERHSETLHSAAAAAVARPLALALLLTPEPADQSAPARVEWWHLQHWKSGPGVCRR